MGSETLLEQPSPSDTGGEMLAEQPSPSDETAPSGAVLVPNELDVFLHYQISGPTAKSAPGGRAEALSPAPHGARTAMLHGNAPVRARRYMQQGQERNVRFRSDVQMVSVEADSSPDNEPAERDIERRLMGGGSHRRRPRGHRRVGRHSRGRRPPRG